MLVQNSIQIKSKKKQTKNFICKNELVHLLAFHHNYDDSPTLVLCQISPLIMSHIPSLIPLIYHIYFRRITNPCCCWNPNDTATTIDIITITTITIITPIIGPLQQSYSTMPRPLLTILEIVKSKIVELALVIV